MACRQAACAKSLQVFTKITGASERRLKRPQLSPCKQCVSSRTHCCCLSCACPRTPQVGQLFWRLNAGQVSAGVLPKLQQLCAAVDAGDMHTANHLQVGWGCDLVSWEAGR